MDDGDEPVIALVWFYIGALAGLTGWLFIAEAIPRLREANRRVNADIAFMQSIPAGVERDEA